MKKTNNIIINYTKDLLLFTVSFLIFLNTSAQSDVILDCENPINEEMTLVNNGSTPISTSIAITCVEITDPECFGTEGLVEFTWESSSNIFSGEFILEATTSTGENEYGGIIVFNDGGTVSMNPEPGEYLLKFLNYQNNDIFCSFDACEIVYRSRGSK